MRSTRHTITYASRGVIPSGESGKDSQSKDPYSIAGTQQELLLHRRGEIR